MPAISVKFEDIAEVARCQGLKKLHTINVESVEFYYENVIIITYHCLLKILFEKFLTN